MSEVTLSPRIRRPRAEPRIVYSVPIICAAYAFPKVSPVRAAPIGIVSLGGGYRPSDLVAAFAAWGLPVPQIVDVSVDGGRNAPGSDADAENALDIQVSAAAYAYCTGQPARVYFASAPNTDQGFADAVARLVSLGCAVISISWGAPEDAWGSAIPAFSKALAAAKAAGATIFAASGDNDSGDGESGVHVDYPASDPSVIGCGGTTRTATAETVWSDGRNGTGGGYSAVFPRQAFQVGAPAGAGRMVPDVAANADPNTGYQIRIDGSWQVLGGTSAVAPLYAGLFAALASTGAVTGDALAKLWQHPAAFSDIATGNNGKWRAQAGPDPCTGLGVVRGAAILAALGGSAPTPPPVVQPPPPAKLGQILIDLDAKTVALPAGFTVAPTAPAAIGDGSLLAIGLDGLRIYADAMTHNLAAIPADVAKLLADLKRLGVPAPAPAAA